MAATSPIRGLASSVARNDCAGSLVWCSRTRSAPLTHVGVLSEPLRLHHPDWSDERVGARVAESLRMVDLDPKDFLNRFPMDLSGGQAQRAAIARAIVDHPRILLADEPMSAIDVAARIRILDSFRRIRQAEPDMALIMVSHDLGVVRHIADRIVVLHDGRVEESGLTGEVLDAPRRDYTRELIRAASL